MADELERAIQEAAEVRRDKAVRDAERDAERRHQEDARKAEERRIADANAAAARDFAQKALRAEIPLRDAKVWYTPQVTVRRGLLRKKATDFQYVKGRGWMVVPHTSFDGRDGPEYDFGLWVFEDGRLVQPGYAPDGECSRPDAIQAMANFLLDHGVAPTTRRVRKKKRSSSS